MLGARKLNSYSLTFRLIKSRCKSTLPFCLLPPARLHCPMVSRSLLLLKIHLEPQIAKFTVVE
jgi:hypothetical protein